MVMTIPLHGKLAEGRVALVDDEDYELVSAHRWYAHKPNPRSPLYARATIRVAPGPKGKRRVYMHRLVTGSKYRKTDHKNRDGLDNQKHNLREATDQQNSANTGPKHGLQYKGVDTTRNGKRWVAYIRPNGRKRHLGTYDSPEDAARAYDVAAREAFGEYAHTNF